MYSYRIFLLEMTHVVTSLYLTLNFWNMLYNETTLGNICSLVHYAKVAAQYSVHCTSIPRDVCLLLSNTVHHYQDTLAICVPTLYTIMFAICVPTLYVIMFATCVPALYTIMFATWVPALYTIMFATCVPALYTIMFATCVPALADSPRTKIPVSETVVRAETLWGPQSAGLHKETRGISS